MRFASTRASALALATSLVQTGFTPAAAQQAIVVAPGQTDTAQKTVGGTDTVTVRAGGTLATTTNPAINWSTASTDLRIGNAGTIRSTANGGRAINGSGAGNPRTVTLTNAAGAVIESQDDAFRINVAPTGGTIRVDNAGIIRTTNGGQALDFDAVAGNATILVNNAATGELRSFGQDAIRPGQGAIVSNAGLILADGPANNNYDGVDWQQKSGTVINQATGAISGLRHGITSDITVDVTNDGTITGRNGSGVGSDGTGIVVNRGTITGRWDGVANNGDGDGVDIDLVGTVRNFGTIQGLTANGSDSGGRPNSAQGVAMGGGTIENAAGATILGGAQGVLVNLDTNPGGAAVAATTITNGGTIRGTGAEGIQLIGAFADTITTSGLIAGGNGTALDMGDGNDTLNVLQGATFVGTARGGSGNDRIVLGGGTGAGSLGAAEGFESLVVSNGSWTLTSPSNFANGIDVAAGAGLAGDTATLGGTIRNAGTVTFNQAQAGSFAGVLGGSGQLVKAGAGTLIIGSQLGFTGATSVAGGRLLLAGALPSAVTVGTGATLTGAGTIAALTVADGGTVSGTLAVTRNFIQAAGSTYAAAIGAAGAADLIAVGGTATIATGAQLAVTREAGGQIGARYTLLTAAGGVTGSYTLVQTPVGDTELRLIQNGTGVSVAIARTAGSLRRLAVTGNQSAVAGALSGLGSVNPLVAALTLIPDAAVVRGGFDQLSGDAHASLRTGQVRDADTAAAAVLDRTLETGAGGAWLQAIGRGGEDGDSADGTGTLDSNTWGVFAGADFGSGDTGRLGVAGGYTRTRVSIDGRGASGRIESKHVLGYGTATIAGFVVRGGVGYAWTENSLRRTVVFPGFIGSPLSRYDGSTLHGFAEVAAPFAALAGTIEPFARVAARRVETDAFVETGGAEALRGAGREETFTLGTLGLRGTTPIVDGLSARGSVGWQRRFGRRSPTALVGFATGPAFLVDGAALSRDSASLSIDALWKPADRISVRAGYSGTIGGAGEDSRFQLGLSMGF